MTTNITVGYQSSFARRSGEETNTGAMPSLGNWRRQDPGSINEEKGKWKMENEKDKGNALYRFGRHTGYNDAIDKAVEWIDHHAQDYVRIHAISGEITFFRLKMINDFRQFMKNSRP